MLAVIQYRKSQKIDGVIQLRSEQGAPSTFARPLPIVISIRLSPTTPEGVLANFVADLRIGDIVSALQVVPSAKDAERIRALDTQTRIRLANSLANARLLEAQPMFRIYAGQWVDDAGASREVKFFVSRNIQSNWTISF